MYRPKTYETKFRAWGPDFSKNRKAALWKAVGSKIQKRSQQGKQTNVSFHGNLIAENKVRKAIERYAYKTVVERFFSGNSNNSWRPKSKLMDL